VLLGARSGLRSPILPSTPGDPAAAAASNATAWADPIPQAVILTAIVIGLSIQALVLVVVSRLAQTDPLLDLSSFDEGNPP
jgi:multicomponent Na+:H+ antiporter subunit C